MSKNLTEILLDTEDVIRALEVSGNYDVTGLVRKSFTKRKQTILRVSPGSKTEFVYVERIKPTEENS